MATLFNDERNISVRIELIDNESTDIIKKRSDNMNWIPFNLLMNVGDDKIIFHHEVSPSLCVRELKYLIGKLWEVLQVKKRKDFIEDPFKFISKEYLFEVIIYETREDDLIYFDWWFNMGSLTNGHISGYSKGYRFVVTLESLELFTSCLEDEFHAFLQKYY